MVVRSSHAYLTEVAYPYPVEDIIGVLYSALYPFAQKKSLYYATNGPLSPKT